MALTDGDRLAVRELVYRGIVRTPVMALAHHVDWQGQMRPLMAEHFATSADVFRLTGDLDEAADAYPAADGGAKTPLESARRLAR
ncbi:MAG: tetrahydromethanopterin biosynthesis protein, partial [Betaproteobacteria bacterium]|nr:tetrahydromethanopterin biosynthesis protein [Betaproteobacteria bacterium]